MTHAVYAFWKEAVKTGNYPLPAGLSRTQRHIWDLVDRWPGITAERLVELLWAHDQNGGPETGRKCVHVHVYHLNKKLKSYGLMVRAPFGASDDGYRIIPI